MSHISRCVNDNQSSLVYSAICVVLFCPPTVD